MKKVIVFLSVLLALLLAVAAFLVLQERSAPAPPASLQTTAEAASTTEETAPPGTTTEAEPEPELQENPAKIVLNGVALETFLLDDAVYTGAEEFAGAVGLTLESESPVKMTGRDTVEYTATGMTVTVMGEKSYTLPGKTVTTAGKTYVEFSSLAAALDYPVFEDPETGVTYYTPGAREFSIPEGVDVPVIMYHAVSDDCWGIDELFVSPEDMEEQLAYLVDNGYDPIWFEDLAYLDEYEKPVILTFDDGYDDNYTELFPLLQKYQVKATVFVIGNAPGTSHKMTEEQIRELSDSGLVSIQSHSYTHEDMDTLDEEDTLYEMEQSNLAITRITGKVPYVLCYPTGKYNDYTLELAPRYYHFGLKMVGGQYNTSDDPFLVSRYYMSRYYSLSTFAEYLSSAGDR